MLVQTVILTESALSDVQSEVTDALEADDLDHLLKLDGATQKYPENCATDSIVAKLIAKADPANPNTYDMTTDSLEALSDKLGGFSGDGGAAQDDSVKAASDLAHTDLDAIIAAITAQDALVITERIVKTVAFDGGAGSGAVGSVAVFTVTGLVDYAIKVVCTETLIDGADLATISLGTATVTDELIDVTDAAGKNGTTIETNDLWFNNTPGAAGSVSTALLSDTSKERSSMGEDIIFTIAGEAISDGTLVVSIIYTKCTSGASIVEAA